MNGTERKNSKQFLVTVESWSTACQNLRGNLRGKNPLLLLAMTFGLACWFV